MSNLKLIGGYFHILINYWKWNCWSLVPIFVNRRFDGFTLKIVRIWTHENKFISFPQIHWTFQMNLKLIVGYLPIKKNTLKNDKRPKWRRHFSLQVFWLFIANDLFCWNIWYKFQMNCGTKCQFDVFCYCLY